MMAKAPVPGRVKTHLCPPLSSNQAARLARAFAADSWAVVAELAPVRRVLVIDGDPGCLPTISDDTETWAQTGGDLGARMEAAARRALATASAVVLIGTDAPGLPPALLQRAFALLRTHDAVVGPAADGGYYLLGLSSAPDGLLAELPWSSPRTRQATVARLRERNLSVVELAPWFDVDDAADLRLLRLAIGAGFVAAPATARVLADFDRTGVAL